MNANEVKIRLRDKQTQASQIMLMSRPKRARAFYEGKTAAFAEAIELIEELEK